MPHLPHLIYDLALILGAAAVTTLIFKGLKQPVVLGYLLAGILVGPHTSLFPTVSDTENIQTWAEIGVLFLMFGLGLEFSFKKLMKVGSTALITAIFGVGLTAFLGYNLGILMGWANMNSIYLGGILAISSTTIIIRSFDELGIKEKKFAGIVTGTLIFEDLVAILLMVILSTVAVSRQFEGAELIYSVAKLGFFLILWFIIGIFLIPSLFKRLSLYLNEESLLILSVALCLSMVLLAVNVGFSSALGAFIMGSLLAETHQANRIEKIIEPLKTFFAAVFFVSVGMLIDPNSIIENWIPIVLASLVMLIGKPIFATLGTLISGQSLHTSIQTGMTLSQIGEFSFIIASLGVSLKVTSNDLYPIAVSVSVLTSVATPFMIKSSDGVFLLAQRVLPQKWKVRLDQFNQEAQHIPVESSWRKILKAFALNTVIFGVLILAVIFFITRYLPDYIPEMPHEELPLVGLGIVLLAPLLWGLSFKSIGGHDFRQIRLLEKGQRSPLVVLQLVRIAFGIFFVGYFFRVLYSPLWALIAVSVTLLILYVLRHRVKSVYGHLEGRFMENWKPSRDTEASRVEEMQLWDVHVAHFRVDNYAPFVGRSLEEARLREKFGVNIARIKRGDDQINSPGKNEKIFPGDELTVLGNDEQLQKLKTSIERKKELSVKDTAELKVTHFEIESDSDWAGKSIRDSKIRETLKGLVIGIERGGEQLLNPESTTIIEVGDILWVTGEQKRLRVVKRKLK